MALARCYDDPYTRSFTATVAEVVGDGVLLTDTLFFPGGGGQAPDEGTLNGIRVVGVEFVGDRVLHRLAALIPVGTEVRGEVDWARRYDLMRGHTGEHLLFGTLQRLRPSLELVKIAITPEKKSIFVRGEADWPLIAQALREVNGRIAQGAPVTESVHEKTPEALSGARAKLERIAEDKVRVIHLGDFDHAACAGLHVRDIAEVGALFVTRLVSARPAADFEIEFLTGPPAIEAAVGSGTQALESAELLGAPSDHLVPTVENLRREAERLRESQKRLSNEVLAALRPEPLGGIQLYQAVLFGVERRRLQDAVTSWIEQPNTAAVLADASEGLFLIVAAHPGLGIDCRHVLTSILQPLGGKGGGKPHFAQGGLVRCEQPNEVLAAAVQDLQGRLSETQQTGCPPY